MPITTSEPTTKRGRKDARRHREKQREAIIGKLPEIIADESIITQKKGKIIKIPIRSIDLPHFRPKTGDEQEGIGQGDGQPGDVIGHRPGQGKPGEPGQEPGEDYIETEVEIEEIIELMLEDLGLPELKEKEVKELIVELGFKIGGIVRSGSWPLLDRKATARHRGPGRGGSRPRPAPAGWRPPRRSRPGARPRPAGPAGWDRRCSWP